MPEKLEQSKEFIREISILTNRNMWLNIAMEHIYKSEKSFPVLYKYIFCDGFQDAIANQITFAKIWAGEIELVEKKGKYVVYKELDETHFCIYHQSKDGVFSHRIAILNEFESADDLAKHPIKDQIFDEDVAFLLRDSKIFEIAEVVG